MTTSFVSQDSAQPAPLISRVVMGNDAIDIWGFVRILWRGWFWLALSVIVALALALYLVLFVAKPQYPATAVVALEQQQEQLVTGIESVISGGAGDAASVNTEIAVLKSRILIGKLVTELDLVNDPEFNPNLVEPSPYSIRRLIALLRPPRAPSDERVFNAVVDSVVGKISVINPRQSYVFNINITTGDAEKSALIVNTLARLYIDEQLAVKFEANERAITFLSKRAGELQQTLESMESERNAFFEQDQLITPEALAASTDQLRERRSRLTEVQSTLLNMTAQRQLLQDALGDPQAFEQIAQDSRLSQIIRARGLASPLVATAMNDVLERQSIDMDRLQQQQQILTTSIEQISGQVERQSGELIALQQVERELDATRLLYESFLTRLKETNVQQGLQEADSRVLSNAVPRPPSSPSLSRTVMILTFLSVIATSTLLIIRELRFKGFRTPDELNSFTNLTTLSAIPLAPRSKRKALVEYLREKPNSIVTEAIRNLRTSLMMSNTRDPKQKPQVIMITSSIPGEGKTTLSLGLANNMLGLGKKVLLIEADIRRRTFSSYFDTTQTANLIDLMKDPSKLKDANLLIESVGVDVIVGAKTSMNAADVFSSDPFKNLIDEARKQYDYILIDTPPVLAVSDARVIRPLADAMLYVVLWNSTSKAQVNQGVQMFQSIGQVVTGLALNKVDSKAMRGYGYAGEYGYDSYNSKYYDI